MEDPAEQIRRLRELSIADWEEIQEKNEMIHDLREDLDGLQNRFTELQQETQPALERLVRHIPDDKLTLAALHTADLRLLTETISDELTRRGLKD